MSAAQQLFELQELDLSTAAAAAKLETERSKIQEPRSLHDAQEALKAAEAKLESLQKSQREIEREIEDLTQKKKSVHTKLYSGQVSVPRELSALEAEEETLRREQTALEDQDLEQMTAAEETEHALARATATLQAETERWQRDGAEARRQVGEIEAELKALQAEREEFAARISRTNLALYERLRAHKVNHPVALIENGSCQGCRVQATSSEVQKARSADPPRLCDNCGRILYVR